MGYDQYSSAVDEFSNNEQWLEQEKLNQFDSNRMDSDRIGNDLNNDLENDDKVNDENSYKLFLMSEQQNQQQQLSKLLFNNNKQTSSLELDEDYLKQGEQEEEESTDNEELNAINQCQLDSNYTSNQINQTGNLLHSTNGLGEVYTIPEETEDEDPSSPDSLKINIHNLDSLAIVQSNSLQQPRQQQTAILGRDSLESTNQATSQVNNQAKQTVEANHDLNEKKFDIQTTGWNQKLAQPNSKSASTTDQYTNLNSNEQQTRGKEVV